MFCLGMVSLGSLAMEKTLTISSLEDVKTFCEQEEVFWDPEKKWLMGNNYNLNVYFCYKKDDKNFLGFYNKEKKIKDLLGQAVYLFIESDSFQLKPEYKNVKFVFLDWAEELNALDCKL